MVFKYKFFKCGLNYDEVSNYSNETCDIFSLKNNFDKSKLSNYFYQIQFH